ncbi:invasion associated locus B family protein [Ahrensia marina]|jgi:invasion protein IalB|uniref:Signal peptide protein n=1 Tax=Ahrensia marina TaxID=1514904 RepID=A0A0M9GKR5_9HYPH|nr:invasion associated locus B family protein [Ahrensia marina]KPB00087.1 signal peptide protein [Ahrensia marina]
MFQGSKITKSILAAGVLAATTAVASAQTPNRIGQFNDWSAISYQGANGKICYAVSVPTSNAPASVNHGDNFFVVTQRRGSNVSYEPQFIAGYTLKESSKVTVNIDGKDFSFFSKANTAWTENAAEDPAIVAAMRAGSKMNIKATSRRGTNTSYEYSLSGITAALKAIEDCK